MAGNAIDELINNLYEMVQDAFSVPLGGDRCVLDREKALDILDEIRANLPSDLRMAREIVEKRNEVISAGKREYDSLKNQADEYARQKVNEHEIAVAARKKAADVVSQAEARAKEVMKAAADYCEDAMKRAETALEQTVTELKKSHSEFRAVMKEQR